MPTIYLAKDVYDELVRLGQSPENLTNKNMRAWVKSQTKEIVEGKVKKHARNG